MPACEPELMIPLMKTSGLFALTASALLITGCVSDNAAPDMSKYELAPEKAKVEFCTVTHVNAAHRYVVSRLPDDLPKPEPGHFVMIYQPAGSSLRAAFIGVVRSVADDGMTVTFTRGEGDDNLPRIKDLIEIREKPLTAEQLKKQLTAK